MIALRGFGRGAERVLFVRRDQIQVKDRALLT
jgi:hypothetical protein